MTYRVDKKFQWVVGKRDIMVRSLRLLRPSCMLTGPLQLTAFKDPKQVYAAYAAYYPGAGGAFADAVGIWHNKIQAKGISMGEIMSE